MALAAARSVPPQEIEIPLASVTVIADALGACTVATGEARGRGSSVSTTAAA